jgi:hypothetical protein
MKLNPRVTELTCYDVSPVTPGKSFAGLDLSQDSVKACVRRLDFCDACINLVSWHYTYVVLSVKTREDHFSAFNSPPTLPYPASDRDYLLDNVVSTQNLKLIASFFQALRAI